MVLGFLPLTKTDEEAVLNAVIEDLKTHSYRSITGLLRAFPAATAYALAVAPSRSLTTGGNFWPALNDDLGLDVVATKRAELAAKFRQACSTLGLIDRTIENTGWVHAAPFIFQAGILHYWKDALASALRTTLRHVPAPDLEDSLALKLYSKHVDDHTHNQPTLKRLLNSEIGPLLIRRLVSAYLSNNWAVLPPHLQAPIRDAFSESGHGVFLRSPYLSFNTAFGQMEVILPAQSSRLASPDTYWQVDGRRYTSRCETSLPIGELSGTEVNIELRELGGGFNNQSFTIETLLDGTHPFKIFRKDSGRERRTDLGKVISLPPGEYLVLMDSSVTAGEDEAYVVDRPTFREIEIELRPGDEPLHLYRDDSEWAIQTTLQQGFYVNRDIAEVTMTEDGPLLHYGDNLGLTAYLPSEGIDETAPVLTVTCEAQSLDSQCELPVAASSKNNVYRFQDDLNAPISEALTQLAPGVHLINIKLSYSARHVSHTLWYWKGLRQISEAFGFQCTDQPQNINIKDCRGLHQDNGNLCFKKNYHAPTVTLAISSPTQLLRIPRAGVQVLITEPGLNETEEPSSHTPLIVMPNDRRVLQFRSGGFQNWSIYSNDRLIIELNKTRTCYAISLAGNAAESGGAGVISARGENGESIRLAAFSRPLTANHPRQSLDHAANVESWSFSVPTNELASLGVLVTDLSETPAPEDGTISSIAERTELGFDLTEVTVGEDVLNVSSAYIPTAEDTETGRIKVSANISIGALEDRLYAIDVYRKTEAAGEWLPLDCTEKHGYSTMRFYAWGDQRPADDAGWWQQLRRANRNETGTLKTALNSIQLSELDLGLKTCRDLLAWKYPSSVWNVNAHRIQDFPVHLGRHRFNIWDGSAAIWWQQGAEELSDYASKPVTPVTRQFLLGSQPSSLRIPREFQTINTGKAASNPVGRCLNVAAQICQSGSLKDYILSATNSEDLNRDVIFCYQNFQQVSTAQAPEFVGFSLCQFLEGGDGIPSLKEQTEELYRNQPRFEVTALLSPEHLLSAIRALNRRSRAIEVASQEDSELPLAKVAQTIETIHQQIEFIAPSIAQKIAFDDADGHLWHPPLLENRWSVKIAEIAWMVAAISRLAAHKKISPEEFETQLGNLLCRNDPTGRKVQNRLCILLSIAPELFSFYIALFELLFPVTPNE